ncbi:MAG: hypothetical protein JXA10_00580 [Anaerolineae bacterium]|nr:hypothetical protein [Anaerolineae bacterium]
MATEFTVVLDDKPGSLADLAEALAQNAVNIMAIHAAPCPQEGHVQFITNNADATMNALRDAGLDYAVQNVLVVPLPNEPGTLARVSRALGASGVNINALYITMERQVVLDVDDLHKAQDIVMGMGFHNAPD